MSIGEAVSAVCALVAIILALIAIALTVRR